MLSATAALERLQQGNRRFVAGDRSGGALRLSSRRRQQLVAGQEPFAVVLGCSDSRVPAEIVFDQGLGDLFVVRVAGNIAGSSQIGSVEFAVQQFGTRLVVVLGHSRCGAVAATLEAMQNPAPALSPHLRAIVDHIRPAVEPLVRAEPALAAETLLRRAVRANVRAAARRLSQDSPVLAGLIQHHGLRVVGAEYAVETGEVAFFDRDPLAGQDPLAGRG